MANNGRTTESDRAGVRVAAQLQAIGAAILFSTGGAAIKACALSGWQVAGLRSGIAGLAILVVGLAGERQDGLMAAVLLLCAFTLYFATSLVLRPLERKNPQP
jgi:hypothetical protein